MWRTGPDSAKERVPLAEAHEVVRVERAQAPRGVVPRAARRIVHEPPVRGHQPAPRSVLDEPLVCRTDHLALRVAARGHAPVLLRARHAAVLVLDPLPPRGVPARTRRVVLEEVVARLPDRVVGDDRRVAGKPSRREELRAVLLAEGERRRPPHVEVHVDAVRAAAAQHVEEIADVLDRRRLDADHRAAHRGEVGEIALDERGRVPFPAHPAAPEVRMLHARDVARPEVDTHRIPRLSAQHEIAVLHRDEIARRIGPLRQHGELVRDHVVAQTHRHAAGRVARTQRRLTRHRHALRQRAAPHDAPFRVADLR